MKGSRMSTERGAEDPIIVLIPVFNDWKAAELLLHDLDGVLAEQMLSVQVLLVDDASTEPPGAGYLQSGSKTAQEQMERSARAAGAPGATAVAVAAPFKAITKIEILELRRNLGHQRAIAIGLAYLHANEHCQAVLVMDGDGEDDPRDVPRLIEHYRKLGGKKVIFARRAQRSEPVLFRICYVLYRLLHQLLTGHGINVGNFSILPFEAVDRLVAVTELWNHYASAVFKARLPADSIPTCRGQRLAGRPRMNFVSLVIHGLSSIAAYGDVVGVRLLLASMGVMVLAALGMLTVVVIRLGRPEIAWPGWATSAFGLLLIIMFQALIGSVMFIFITLSNRQGAQFLPVRDYSYFVLKIRRIACQA
jgi:hypothetical protein